MIATKSMTYAGRRLQVGDRFDAKSARDAKLLRAIGKAQDEATPSDEALPVGLTTDDKPKREYRRKDMKAED